jgi:hypothetical protein
MTIENYFPRLDQNYLRYILFKAGHISELSKVCKLFNDNVKIEANALYQGLENEFGKYCLQYALKTIHLQEKSYPVKIDGLFHAACQNKCGYNAPLREVNYDLKALKQYMRPLAIAESYRKLWAAILKNGDHELKALMSKLPLGQQPFENGELIRQFFKENCSEFQKLTTLNLVQQQLKFLPPEIGYFTRLEQLDLSQNALEELPEEIGYLTKLTDLRLNNNLLQSLPNAIGHLTDLKNFQCSFNQLIALPGEICELRELKTLNLSRNQIDWLPEEMGKLKSLNYLFLESNRLSCLPSSLGELPYLIGLYLFNNQISALPDSLCKMPHLKYLSVQNNGLQALPENIGGIRSLQSLFVDRNGLKELPQSLCALKQLKYLSISYNELSELPEGMGNLQKLNFFDYAHNPLQRFPEGIQDLPFWSINPLLFPRLDNGVEQVVLNASLTNVQFAEVYWRLGAKKWKEGIDGMHHLHGPQVYDLNLHGKYAEPGFLSGIEKGFQFLAAHPNRKIDAEFYLALHKATCGHFNGKETNTLMGQEKVGVFRGLGDTISATFPEPHSMTQSAINGFNSLNGELTLLFGSSFRIGDLSLKSNSPKSIAIYYHHLSREQVEIIFNFFLTEFYYDIGHSQTEESKVMAIAKLIQRIEWLHPVCDGSGRIGTAFLNYILTCYGFTPVILEFPYVTSCKDPNEVTSLLIAGMREWQKEIQ